MFVVEQPFASDFFFRSLEKLQAPVLRGAAVEEFNVANRNLNLVSDKEFVEYYRKIPEPLYCNSENGLSRVATLLPDAPFVRFAELFKNKTIFRQAVAPLYPNFVFREVDLAELQTLRYEDLPRRFVIKPSVGFLSVGVRFVASAEDWERVRAEILRESAAFAALICVNTSSQGTSSSIIRSIACVCPTIFFIRRCKFSASIQRFKSAAPSF